MKGIGKMINSTEKGKNFTQMAQNMKDIFNLVKRKGLEIFWGQINHFIQENFKIIIFMEQVHTNGSMEENSKELGSIIKCTEMESLHFLMEENTLVNFIMIKNKDMAFLLGQIKNNMMVFG